MDPVDIPPVFVALNIQAREPGAGVAAFVQTVILLQGLAPLFPGQPLNAAVQLLQFWIAQNEQGQFGPHLGDYPALGEFQAAIQSAMIAIATTALSSPQVCPILMNVYSATHKRARPFLFGSTTSPYCSGSTL